MEEGGEEDMSYTFYDFPKKCDAGEYGKTLAHVKQRYGPEGLVAIYDWGTPSVPGVSDLDVLLVWEWNAESLPLMKRTFATLPSKDRYILYHPFMHISDNDFENIHYVYPQGKLRKVWGKTLRAKALEKRELLEANAAVLNDIIVRHYPRDFLRQCMEKSIDVRSSLLRLNSLRHTFSTMESLGMEIKIEWEKFSRRVEQLRKGWFADPDTSALSGLVEDALDISMEIVGTFAGYQEDVFGDFIRKLPQDMRFTGIKNSAVFVEDWDEDKAMRGMKALMKNRKMTSILPKAYAAQLACYAQEPGIISSHIKKHLLPLPAAESVASVSLKKRMATLNGQAELALRLKHSDFPAFFDFGYRNQKGVNNTLMRMADALRY